MIELNLLSPEHKGRMAGRRRNRRITAIASSIALVVILVAVGLFGTTLYLGTVVANQEQRVEQAKEDLKRYAEIESLVLAVRERVTVLEGNEKTRILWSKLTDDLAQAVPEGIRLTQMNITTATLPQVQLSGQAQNKEKVASLRERLEASDRFENVTIRQVGEGQDDSDAEVSTFSLDASLTGVKPPQDSKKTQQQATPGQGEAGQAQGEPTQ